jgi:predicted cupin superfamily sugar epimerase
MNPKHPAPSAATADLIQSLDLQAHPEGGFYRETWRSDLTLPKSILPAGYSADRSAGTAILFLLPTGHSSRWHRVKSAELWFHQAGDPLALTLARSIDRAGTRADLFRSGLLLSSSGTAKLVAKGKTNRGICGLCAGRLCGSSRL